MSRGGSRGMTLVEVVVAAGLLAIVVGGLLFALSTGSFTVSRGTASLESLAATALALEHLRQDLRRLVGPVPLPEAVSAGEVGLRFTRLDSVDATTGEGRVSVVTYRFRRNGPRTKTELTRERLGNVTRFVWDRDVEFMAGADSRVGGDHPSIELVFGFPAPGEGAEGRPPLRETVVALNGATAGPDGEPRGQGSWRLSRLVFPGRPWTPDGSDPGSPDELFPPEAQPAQRPTR